MCRSCTEVPGGRRCPRTDATRVAERAASARYYQRAKARALIAALAERGVPAMDDLDCPNTYHLGDTLDVTRPTPTRVVGMHHKPAGLWASPGRVEEDGAVKTGWTDWIATEGGSQPNGTIVHTVRPRPGAVIVRLHTADDIRAFGAAFPRFGDVAKVDPVSRKAKARWAAAWQSVADAGISGVMVTDEGAHAHWRAKEEATSAAEREFADGMDTWDCSTVAWLDNTAVEVTGTAPVGRYVYAEPDPDDSFGWRDLADRDEIDILDQGAPTTPRVTGRTARMLPTARAALPSLA